MPKNKIELTEDLKRKIEDALRIAYQKVGYRNDGEIELNIKGVFLDKYAMQRKDLVVDGKLYQNVMMIVIATNVGKETFVVREFHDVYEKGTIERIPFKQSHCQNLCLMVSDSGEFRYVLRDFDFFDDYDFRWDNLVENEMCKTIELNNMDWSQFKPRDYIVPVSKFPDEIYEELKWRLRYLLMWTEDYTHKGFDGLFQNCLEDMRQGYLHSVLVDNISYQNVYVLTIASESPRYALFEDEEYGTIERYGKTYAYDKSKSLALLINEGGIRLAEVSYTTLQEIQNNAAVNETYEFVDYKAQTLDPASEIDWARWWLLLDFNNSSRMLMLDD